MPADRPRRVSYFTQRGTALALLAILACFVSIHSPTAENQKLELNKRRLNVVGTIPLPGEVLKNRIVLFFDDEIVPVKGDDGQSTRPFTITPPVHGTFQTGPNYISFESETFARDTLYTITLDERLRSARGRRLNNRHRTLSFSPTEFEPKQVWLIEDTSERVVLGIRLPFPVRFEELDGHLGVYQPGGTSLRYKLQHSAGNKIYRIILPPAVAWPVRIHVLAGLKDAGGQLQMRKDFNYTFPKRPPLTVTSLRWHAYQPDQQSMEISFSATVSSNDLARHLTIRDESNGTTIPFVFPLPRDSSRHRISVHLEQPTSSTVTVLVDKGLCSSKTEMAAPYAGRLEHRPIPLRIEYTRWDNRQQGYALMLRLNQPVKPLDLQDHLQFVPDVANIRVEPNYGTRYYIYGDWVSNQSYHMTILAGLETVAGVELQKAIERTVRSYTLPRHFEFSDETKYYFPRRAQMLPRLKTRGYERATLTLYRMFPSNIAVALRDLNNGRGSYTFHQTWSENIGSTTVALVNQPDRITETPVDVDGLFPTDRKGVFCLDALSGKYGNRTTKIILLTDIGVLAHWQHKELVLFAHDLYSLAPKALARVRVYSHKNQLLGEVNTDADGIAHLKNFNTALGSPRVVVVEHGDDYTFLELKARSDRSNSFSPVVDSYRPGGYDAFVYADRNLYRPGETVHLRWIARQDDGRALSDVPLLVTVTKPNRSDLVSSPTVLSTFGTGGMEIETQKNYPTGKYRVALQVPGSRISIGTYEFSLEEFVPNRIKSETTVEDSVWTAGREYEIRVTAQHLFGAPVEGRKCEAKITLQRQPLKTTGWKEYYFGNDSNYTPSPLSCGELRTDKEGNATFKFTYSPPAQATFPMTAFVTGTVYELGGRPVASGADAVVLPSEICLGLAVGSPAERGRLRVLAAAIQPDETPAELDKVTVTLEKQVWYYYVRRYYSHHSPSWSDSFQTIEKREVDLGDGKGTADFEIKGDGYYRVRVSSNKTPQYSTLTFHTWRGRHHITRSEPPSLIKLKLDREYYEIGDEVEIRVESPFDGKGIVVFQNASLQRMIPIDVKEGVGLARFSVTKDHFPNIWAEATVVHAVKKGQPQVYPFSSFAAANIRVKDGRRELKVAFPSLPEEMRPAQKAEFEVQVRDDAGRGVDAEITLAAVDEGIHLITDYQNPDPTAHFSRPRRPTHQRAHYYDKVACDFEKPEAGGGSGITGAHLAKRVAAPGESWIRPVALWSGVVRTGKDGKAKVAMDVPEFTGRLRLVAVACTRQATGAGSSNLFVRRPYMLLTNKPRFLLPGDWFKSSAILFNQTDAPCRVRLKWSFGGVLRDGEGSREIEVPAKADSQVVAEFAAGQTIGQGEIVWEAIVMDEAGKEIERLKDSIPIPVRPPAAFQSHHELVVLRPGEARTFRNVKFIDDERAEIELVVGGSPLLRLHRALGYVVRYPYGCVEQTTSKLMPMYLLRKSKTLSGAIFPNEPQLNYYIEAGIERLFSMQTSSGGLGFWPGSTRPYPYGSVYAFHFLTLVKNGRDFALPEQNYKRLKEYVRKIAMDWTDNSNSGLYRRAYAIYVLALGGDLEAIEQIPRFDAVKVPRCSRYLLAAALAMNTNDKDRVKMYLASTPSEPYTTRERSGTLNSHIRNTAVELLALRQMEGDPNEVHARAKTLTAFLEERRYGSTQETAFVVTALAEYLSDLLESAKETSATIAGPAGRVEIGSMKTYRDAHVGKGGAYTVANNGKADLFLNVTTRGVPEKAEIEAVANKGITVGRTFYASDGNPLEDGPFRQAGSYVVRLDIVCSNRSENIVVADLLPGGLEIENPRLRKSALPNRTFSGAVMPSFLEVRDDRLVLAFNALARGKHRFYYVVNAVTPGEFQHPPVTAECMYDASIFGRSSGGDIVVVP